MSGTLWPILMKPDEVICLAEAVHRLGRTDKMTREICKEFAICRQVRPGSPIEVSAVGLEMVKHGDLYALELLREGRREHPSVRRYFEFLGLQE